MSALRFLLLAAFAAGWDANVITIDAKRPRAEALAVSGDRILAVGTTKQIKALVGSGDAHSHPSIVNPSILRRIRQLGVVVALHSYIREHGDKMEAYGEKRWGMVHAYRSALDMGIPIAGNSDFGVSAADPMLRIEGKVYGPEQRISAEEAIRIWTLGSA